MIDSGSPPPSPASQLASRLAGEGGGEPESIKKVTNQKIKKDEKIGFLHFLYFFLLVRIGVVAGVPRFRVIPLGEAFHERLSKTPDK